MAEYVNATESLWVRGVPPGGLIVGDPDDPQIGRLLAREQIKEAPKSKEGSEK
jgi:hypothetical protein